MAGLTAGSVLQQSGWDVVLLDKGRRPGGRMATRRDGESWFDHGAQFLTVRDSHFQDVVDRWTASGCVKPWFTEDGHLRYRGTDGMAGIARELAKELNVRTSMIVNRIESDAKGWRISTDTGEEYAASTLLLTPPAPQSLALLVGCLDRLPVRIVSALKSVEFDPCFALLATLDGPSHVPIPGYVRPENGPIGFIADNAQKGISSIPTLTIHARADFSRAHFESLHEEVAHLLLQAAAPWLGSKVLQWQLRRWRYSQPVTLCGEPCLYTLEPKPVAFAGDAFGGPRIEGASLSGMAAAHRMING